MQNMECIDRYSSIHGEVIEKWDVNLMGRRDVIVKGRCDTILMGR